MIYINGRFLTNKPTGIENFAYGMCVAIKNLNVNYIILMPNEEVSYYDIDDLKIKKIGKFHGQIWEQIDLSLFFVNRRNDLLISFSGIGPLTVKNQIVTIHDLAVFRHPEWFSIFYRLYYKTLTPIVSKFAQKIITVSKFSKQEIIELLRVKSNKILVIHSAPSDKLDKSVNTKENCEGFIKDKFILAVSSIDPRKNFEKLIESFKYVKSKDLKLFIVGKSNKSFAKTTVYGQEDNIKFLGYVSDEDLKKLYEGAMAFISVSLYEGFGLPPIEAMKIGCPVIVSNLDVSHEVCKDAAIYVDPNDWQSIANGIDDIVSDQKRRAFLKERGYEISKRYSFELSAIKLVKELKLIE